MNDAEIKEFPKWKYRGTESVVVYNSVEEDDLGDGWFDKPGETEATLPAGDPQPSTDGTGDPNPVGDGSGNAEDNQQT